MCPLIVAAATVASAQSIPTAIFTDRPDAPNSIVPGLSTFQFSNIAWSSITLSPNGQWWVLDAFITAPLDRDEVLIRGYGPSGAGAKVFAREADPSFVPGRTFQGLMAQTGVSNSGLVAFAGDLSGDNSTDQFIAAWPDDSGDWGDAAIRPVAWEGQAATGFDLNARWDRIDSPVVIHDPGSGSDQIGFRVLGLQAPSSLSDRGVMLGSRVLARKDTTAPTGQAGPGNPQRPWSTFTIETLRTSADGAHWMVLGSLAGSAVSANVCAVDNRVVAQQGQRLVDVAVNAGSAGGGGGLNSIESMRWPVMAPSGRWAMVADMSDTATVVLRQTLAGPTEMLAGTGSPVTPSSDETWDNSWYFGTFFALALNTQGDAVVGGITNQPIGRSAVLVLHDHTGLSRVLLREGDPVDLNGDGILNDHAFIDGWNPGAIGRGLCLTDDGTLVMLLSIRDHANPDDAGPGGTTINQALAAYHIPDFPPPPPVCPCPADFDQSGGTPDIDDIDAFFSAWLGGESAADADCSGGVPDTADIGAFFAAWLSGGCP